VVRDVCGQPRKMWLWLAPTSAERSCDVHFALRWRELEGVPGVTAESWTGGQIRSYWLIGMVVAQILLSRKVGARG
jgi:hypothetical protein